MPEWRSAPLGEFITFQRGVDITRSQQRDGHVPVISSGGIASYHDTAFVDGPGVIIGRKGTLGKAFYARGPYWPHDTTLWVRDFKGNNPHFVYYFMSRFDVSWLDAGSANPTLNRNHLHPITVTWPDPPTQQAIAEVLGALDDKIAANTRLAATAWTLVQATFQSVQRAATTRARLSNLATFEYGKALPATMREPGDVVVVGSGGASGTHSMSLVQESGVVVGRKGSAGVVHWITGPHFPIDTTFFVRGTAPEFSQPYLYCLLRTLRLNEMNNDSAVPGLNRNEALMLPVRVPSPDVLLEFDRSAQVLIDTSDAAKLENRTLAATRDTLLPRLMSGQLRVKKAEKILSEVGV